jgi:hypothetical protein
MLISFTNRRQLQALASAAGWLSGTERNTFLPMVERAIAQVLVLRGIREGKAA